MPTFDDAWREHIIEEIDSYDDPDFLDTLADAFFESGRHTRERAAFLRRECTAPKLKRVTKEQEKPWRAN